MSRADYAHWNEDQDLVWWQEEGRHAGTDAEREYCDRCGYYHSYEIDCFFDGDDDEEDEEDENEVDDEEHTEQSSGDGEERDPEPSLEREFPDLWGPLE